MPTLYLVRHGEPALKGVMLGRTDPPLSEAGRRQMDQVSVPVKRIYSSPLRRALESANAMAHGAEVIVHEHLAEISLGEWDGKAWTVIEREYPELAAAKMADWTGVTPPDGEPWCEFRERIARAVRTITASPEPVAIVGHIAANACIAAEVAGADPLQFRQDYGQVYEYSF